MKFINFNSLKLKALTEFKLKMPKMGESITEGTIINWLISEGDSFDEGDIILEVATDKVDNEVPAPASGTLIKTLFQTKDVVPVGSVMAILEVSELKKSKSDVISTERGTSDEKSYNNEIPLRASFGMTNYSQKRISFFYLKLWTSSP